MSLARDADAAAPAPTFVSLDDTDHSFTFFTEGSSKATLGELLTRLPVGRTVSDADIKNARDRAVAALRIKEDDAAAPAPLARMIGTTDEREFENILFSEWRVLAAKAARLTGKPLQTGVQVKPPFASFMKIERLPVPGPAPAPAAAPSSHQKLNTTANNNNESPRDGENESLFDTPPEFPGLSKESASPQWS
jgi:hypothetical protein